VIELAKKFVPATDEVWRLQQGNDPECLFFQAMSDKGHYGGRPGASRQGIYVCAPSGKFLASINSNNPDRVLRTLQQGLDRWKDLPAEERSLADDSKIKPKHRWENSYPVGGLVLSMHTRDLPANGEPDQERASKWNQDPIWFSKSEARQWLPEVLEEDAEYDLPRSLAMRLVRLHLVDMVKGQTNTFSEREIKDARIKVKVVELTDELAKVEIAGQTHADSTRQSRRTSPHGVKTQLMGSATYDQENERFSKFELVAVGSRWGYTRFNGRRRDPNEGRIGFVFRLAEPNEPRIAPAFVYQYDADWVKRPNR
jgi:hypothetical protein